MQLQRYQPDLPMRKVTDVRRLEGCKCGGLGSRENMVQIDGAYWHGRCAIATFGLDRVATLRTNFRLDDIGPDAMEALLHR
jgi:hypothetical protein